LTDPAFELDGLNVYYAGERVLADIHLDIPAGSVTAIVGAPGAGKTTLLRCLNRMHDYAPEAIVTGRVQFGGTDLNGPEVDPIELRRRIGMVFSRPAPFARSVFENVAAGARRAGADRLEGRVEAALRRAHLWDEVEGDLGAPAHGLSAGARQRLCIARALAVEPEVLLLDEPCAELDQAEGTRVEDVVQEIAAHVTVVIVPHSLQQASRVSHGIVVLDGGRVVEAGRTAEVFSSPADRRTEEYISGHARAG
jgi:phosphate transport system ATP-binding protein